jgi:hypothetical protein
MAENGRLRKKREVIFQAAIAGGATIRRACKRAGMAERTAYRRLADPQFALEVDNLRREMLTRATARLSATAARAADALRKLLGSEDERVRLAACRWVLQLGSQLREREELERRVAELESLIGENHDEP